MLLNNLLELRGIIYCDPEIMSGVPVFRGKRLRRVEAMLWHGKVEEAIAAFEAWDTPQVKNFLSYLERHRLRLPNYHIYQAQGITIGSGAVESTIKQIGRRIKISGAQWNRANLPQVLKQRCAYLNLAIA